MDLVMPGKRQHFIPRFLQAGFASHQSGGEIFTWVYRKTANPFNSNIINVGVEGHFYRDGANTEADNLITGAERPFSVLIKDLRTGNPASLSDPSLPQLVAHLELRTRHLRQSLLQTGEFVVSRILDLLSDEEAFAALLRKRLEREPSILREALADVLAKENLPKELVEPVIKLVTPLIPAFIEAQKPHFSPFTTKLRALLPETLKSAAKSGHIRALTKSLSYETRADRYGQLTYTVAKYPEAHLILGDSAILFEIDGQARRFKAFPDKDDRLSAVFLPLDPRTVLVGARGHLSGPPAGLPEAVARCSLEYFVAAEDSPAMRLLAQHIGTEALPLTPAELEAIVSELIQG